MKRTFRLMTNFKYSVLQVKRANQMRHGGVTTFYYSALSVLVSCSVKSLQK